MNGTATTRFAGGLGIGQCWHERRRRSKVCRVVGIDPALCVVQTEDAAGRTEEDTIEHFLATHVAGS